MRIKGSYIYLRPDWPNFNWDGAKILTKLSNVRHKQGLLAGKMESLGIQLKDEAFIETLSSDVLNTSEIEGEILDQRQVRSSVASKLGMDIGGVVKAEREVEGIVDIMIDATQNHNKELSKARLFDWHAALFPTGRNSMYRIKVGDWRDDAKGPMRIVSGGMGKPRVHFQAPDAAIVDNEMSQFLSWVNGTDHDDLVLSAAIAHFWFITIHPFEDGNGRIGRAIADLMLCRSEDRPQRFYTMSAQIKTQKSDYYRELESSQKGPLDITDWILWFLTCLDKAIESSDETVKKTIAKHNFWDQHKSVVFNQRQLHTIKKLFGPFYGKLTTSKWAKINKCSGDTALRDIQDLMLKGVLVKGASGGRSTSYDLAALSEI